MQCFTITSPSSPLRHYVTSPELLTHYDVAEKPHSCLGRQIVRVKLTFEERTEPIICKLDLPKPYAKLLTSLEVLAAKSGKD